MEIARVKVYGTRAETVYCGDITAGIIGATVSLEFSPEWAGLSKHVTFAGVTDKSILNVGGSVPLPPEVVSAPNAIVKIGIIGINADEKIAIPTMWAELGTVKPGTPVDMGYEPTLPIWAQLMGMIGDLRGLNTKDKSNLVAAVNEAMQIVGKSGGYYTPAVTQPNATTLEISFTPSQETMPTVEPVTITLPGGSGSGQNLNLTVETITVGESGEPENVPVTGLNLDLTSYSATVGGAFYINPIVTPSDATNRAVTWKSDNTSVATVYSNGYVECIAEGDATITCTTADGGYTATCAVSVAAAESGETEVTLSSISVAYSGGDVAVGTSVTALTGIVVTAHYSDGSTEAVTGYTLSGTIAEGSNTVTVSYGGKTACFTVTGVAESTGDAKVQLSTLERTEGMMGPTGTVIGLGGCYHVTVPYSDGMFISTGVNSTWSQTQYPPVVVLDDGAYTLPSMTATGASVGSLGGKYPAQFTCTLSGYTETAIVYVAMLIGSATDSAIDGKDIFYYIPGGEN